MKWKAPQYKCFHTAAKACKASKEDKEEAQEMMQGEGFFPSLKDEKSAKKCWWIIQNVMKWRKNNETAQEMLESEEGQAISDNLSRPAEELRAEKHDRMTRELNSKMKEIDWND